MKILLIGPYPPPLGGVSVYVKRHLHQLTGEGHTADLLDWANLPRLSRYRRLLAARFKKYDELHLHVLTPGVAQLLLKLGLAGKTAVTIHGATELERWSTRKVRLFDALLRRCKRLTLVGAHLEKRLRDKGLFLTDNVQIRPAFIPPPLEEENHILGGYPQELLRFIDDHHPVLVANASRLTIIDGIDLYGLDLCVELTHRLRTDWPEVGLVFALPAIGDEEYFRTMQRRIEELELGEHIAFLTDQKELWPLFKKADLMVRPANSDGYGVSIAEALYCGCPAVASDVCQRPDGTILFTNRDLEDLVRRCQTLLAAKCPPRS